MALNGSFALNRLVWFRNDLRLHDNETVTSALKNARGSVSFIYIYDETWDSHTPEGYPRLGLFRKKFLAESLMELRQSLRSLGTDLICAFGDPVKVIPGICKQLEIGEIFFSRLSAFDERQQEIAIERDLKLKGVTCQSFQTHTLLCQKDLADLDFSRSMSFSKFRNRVEKSWKIHEPLPAVSLLTEGLDSQVKVTLTEWRPESFLSGPKTERGFAVKGGESRAFERVQDYFWTQDRLRVYKETRNGLFARDDSSKFSPFLALGSVSPRFLFEEVRRYEKERVKNSSTLWFLYELLWRDYFHFAALRRAEKLFSDESSAGSTIERSRQLKNFESWRLGQTGHSFVDASMNELRLTGWMSNRMRQNAASFFIFNMSGDWRAGARWFESCLIDYDPASNWGNWSYVAGAGAENQPHIFDVDQQARAYDADGEYRKIWTDR